MTVYRCIHCPESSVVAVRLIADSFGPDYVGMFTAAFSPTGTSPVTHYLSAGQFSQEFADAMDSTAELIAGMTIFDYQNTNGLFPVIDEEV